MVSIKSDQRGAFFVWLILITALVIWGMFWLADQRSSNESDAAVVESAEEEQEDSDLEVTTRSFRAVNNYAAGGKAVITEDGFGYFTIKAAPTLPSEFPGTNYYAKIIGTGTTPDVEIGKLSKSGGTFGFKYASSRPISDYYKLVIFVDGEAATVEGKTLPHNVVELSL